MTDEDEVLVTGLAAFSAYGRGLDALADAVFEGRPGFTPVTRFDVTGRRASAAALAPGAPDLGGELEFAIRDACDHAGLSAAQRAETRLMLAVADRDAPAVIGTLEARGPLPRADRVYTGACVAASSGVAAAAAAIKAGRTDRVVVAAGYLVDPYRFALFDSGRVLSTDGRVRPFSVGRKGMLLGDAVAAVVLESGAAARGRSARALARIAGWGWAADAHHVSNPHPRGRGLGRAIEGALRRAGADAAATVDYVNAHGAGTAVSDPAESAALHTALGERARHIPISSSKSVHGNGLEAAGLLELVVTVLTLNAGRLPVNAGFVGVDEECALPVVETARTATARSALTLNAAFGGANTALLVGAA